MNRFLAALMVGCLSHSVAAQTRSEVIPEASAGSALMRSVDRAHADRDLRAKEAAAVPPHVLEYNRTFLAEFWEKAGLAEAEAKSVAATFESTEEQFTINARARREGREATVAAALQAYSDNRPLLANQLVVAAARAPVH